MTYLHEGHISEAQYVLTPKGSSSGADLFKFWTYTQYGSILQGCSFFNIDIVIKSSKLLKLID
jgi:hypothetical protein